MNQQFWLIWRECGFQGSSPTYMRLVLLQTWPSLCNHCMPIQLVRFSEYLYLLTVFIVSPNPPDSEAIGSRVSKILNSCIFLHYTMVNLMYSYAGYMIGNASLSHRLGGLYCLYCLYETQPFKPPFKIYLSLGVSSLRTWFYIVRNFTLGYRLYWWTWHSDAITFYSFLY